jgi:hypothetical protein
MFRTGTIVTRTLTTLAALATLVTAVPASAQDSRDAQLAAQQAEKATRLRPYEPEHLEKRFETLGTLISRKERRFYPFIGSAFDGGGIALGPGYRTRYADTGRIDAHAAWSVRNYKAAEASLTLPALASDRLSVGFSGHWVDAPDVAFYGVGNDSLEANRTGLEYRATTVGVFSRFEPAPLFAVGGGLDVIDMKMSAAAESRARAVASPLYGRTHVFAEVDSRTSENYTRRGGLYRVQWSDYRQTNGSSHSFRRLDAEVRQFVPILRENWVIATRALVSSTMTDNGQEIPYVLLPDLGGNRTLRGYSAWRFRDRERLLLTGEYRWTAGQLVDMALFVDAGKVAARASDLNLRDLTTTYGIDVSIHTPTSTAVRVELARTPDGNSLVLAFGPSF